MPPSSSFQLLKEHLFSGEYTEFHQLADQIKAFHQDPGGQAILNHIRTVDSNGWLSFRTTSTDKNQFLSELHRRQQELLDILGPEQQISLLATHLVFDTWDISDRLIQLIKPMPSSWVTRTALNTANHPMNISVSFLAQQLLFHGDWQGFDTLRAKLNSHWSLNSPVLVRSLYLFYAERGIRGFCNLSGGSESLIVPFATAGFLLARDENFFAAMENRGVDLKKLTGFTHGDFWREIQSRCLIADLHHRLHQQLFLSESILNKINLGADLPAVKPTEKLYRL